MKKKEIYEELVKEFTSHHQNICWIMRSADDSKELKKINMFLPNRLVEIQNLLELLKRGEDISINSPIEFSKELKCKMLFDKTNYK